MANDYLTALVALTTGLWWIWAPGLAIAALFAVGLARAAGRPMPEQTAWDQHVADAVALSETPIFDALFADQVLSDIDHLPEVRR